MFGKVRNIGTLVLLGVEPSILVWNADLLVFLQFATKVGAKDCFFTQFRSDGRTTQCPLSPSIQPCGIDIASMKVFTRLAIFN